MRRLRKLYRPLALAGVLTVVGWGCSTDSPTAPEQQFPPPPPPPGQTYVISVHADPGGIVIPEEPTGAESTTLVAEVRVGDAAGPPPPDGTTVLLTTSLGSLDDELPVRSIAGILANGRVFFSLFAGGLPIQLGVAVVAATLQSSRGEVEVPISFLHASFIFENPEGNFSVDFTDTSAGSPETFLWNFGHGTGLSSERNPVHEFPGPGTYCVRLTVTKTVGGVELFDATSSTTGSGPPDGCDVTIGEEAIVTP